MTNTASGRRVLLVEDDAAIGAVVSNSLTAHGYQVRWCATGAEARASVDAEVPSIVLLDAGLPDADGFELCRAWRDQHRDLPIVLVTARDDEIDIVEGLDAGANDYIAKPFSMRILLARVRAQLRQSEGTVSNPTVVGRLRVEPEAYQVFVDDTEVVLRPRELELLAILAREAGRVVPRERLLAEVWDVHWKTSSKTLDVHVLALRRQLDGVVQIVAVRGVGYRLDAT